MFTDEQSSWPSDADSSSEREREELAEVLRQWTRSEDEARAVLDVLAEALEVARLPIDDVRLHVNFGTTTKWAVNIVIGKRSVAWLDERRCFFGLLLDDQQLADRKAAVLHPEGYKTMFRQPEAPALKLHVRHLRNTLPDVRDSWHRAIRAEVGRGFANPYRSRHHRPSLFAMLSDSVTRSEVARRAHQPRYWWFGVNLRHEGYVRLNQIAPFLNGTEDQFKWPFGSSTPKALYAQMRPGDRALIWTGPARGSGNNWGVLGTATILDSNQEGAILGGARPFPKPLTPYPEGLPAETNEVRFLARTFGQDFAALGDVMRAVFGVPRRPPIAVAEISRDAFRAVMNWAAVPESAAAASTHDDDEGDPRVGQGDPVGNVFYSMDYVAALERIRDSLSVTQVDLLSALCSAPGNELSASRITRLLGLRHHSAVNAATVRLAKALTRAVEAEPPRRADGSARWWHVVAEGRYTEDNRRFLWKLRPALRDAALAVGIGSVDRGTFADELEPTGGVLFEGAVKLVRVNVYERNPVARRRCIDHYGAICSVCNFDFAAVYGPIADGFIHVHHLRLISECGGEDYEVDPIEELRPVCPNCHAILHRRDPPLEINELKLILAEHRERRSSI
jgi:5-methylcytosine-specific restriction protein A